MDPSVPHWIPGPCPPPTRVPMPHHDEMPPENTIPFLLQLTSEHNVLPQQHQQQLSQHHQQVHHHQQQQQQQQQQQHLHYMHRPPVPEPEPVQRLSRMQQQRQDMETQTLSWDEMLRQTIQKFLAHKVSNLIDRHNISGNNCIHIKGLSLEDVLGLVVEHHHKVCLNQDEIPKPQILQTTAHVPVASYSETEAAASVMVEMLNLQHESILAAQQQANNMYSDTVDINFIPTQPTQPVPPPKKPARKRSFAPVENTKEELLKRNIKIIRCDPPEEVMRQAQKGLLEKGPDGKRKHVPAKKWFQCADCGKKMEDISKLARHSALHTDLRPYGCSICQKSYKTRDMLNKHRKTHLPREQVWKVSCPYCGKKFASRPERDKHVVIHTGERNKKCHECGETFRNATTLKQHRLRKHGLGKCVQCPFCLCTGVTKSRLSSHVAGVHKAQLQKVETGILICPHKCLVCNQEFSDEPTLVEHMLGHGKGTCSTCKSRKFRHVRLKAHARRLGLSPSEIDGKDVDELGEWVKDERKKKDTERLKKRSKEIYERAVAKGMDPELAKDRKAAKEFLKQLETLAKDKNKNKTKEEALEDAERVREYLRRQREGKPGWNRPIKKEDLPQGVDVNLVNELKYEIERLKQNINQSAMEIALDIIEEISVEDVMEQNPMEQEMVLIRAELEARKKKGNTQKSLAKKIMGEKIDDDEHVMFKTTTPEVDEMQMVEAEETGDSRHEIGGEVDNMMAAAKAGRYLRPKVIEEGDCNLADLTCTVYSQSPRDTLRMIKQGRITYVFIPSMSSKLYATHMRTKPMQTTSLISQKMFVNTDDPEAVKLELLAGQLSMKIVPLVLKKQNMQEETSPLKENPPKPLKGSPKASKAKPEKKGMKTTHTAIVMGSSGPSKKGGKKRPTRSKAVRSDILLKPSDPDAEEDEECMTCTLYTPDSDATLQLIKSGEAQFFVAKSDAPNVTATHNKLAHGSKLSEKITIHTHEPDEIKASYLRLKIMPLPGGAEKSQNKPGRSSPKASNSLKRKKTPAASPKKTKIKIPAKKVKTVTKKKTGSSKPNLKRKTDTPPSSSKRKTNTPPSSRPKRARVIKKPVIYDEDDDQDANPDDIVEVELDKRSPTKSMKPVVFISVDTDATSEPGTDDESVNHELLAKPAEDNERGNLKQIDEAAELEPKTPMEEEQEHSARESPTPLEEEQEHSTRESPQKVINDNESPTKEQLDEQSSAQSENVSSGTSADSIDTIPSKTTNADSVDTFPSKTVDKSVPSGMSVDSNDTSPTTATENIEVTSSKQIATPSTVNENIEMQAEETPEPLEPARIIATASDKQHEEAVTRSPTSDMERSSSNQREPTMPELAPIVSYNNMPALAPIVRDKEET